MCADIMLGKHVKECTGARTQPKEHERRIAASVSAASVRLKLLNAIKRQVECVESADDYKATLNYLTVNSHLQMCSC